MLHNHLVGERVICCSTSSYYGPPTQASSSVVSQDSHVVSGVSLPVARQFSPVAHVARSIGLLRSQLVGLVSVLVDRAGRLLIVAASVSYQVLRLQGSGLVRLIRMILYNRLVVLHFEHRLLDLLERAALRW